LQDYGGLNITCPPTSDGKTRNFKINFALKYLHHHLALKALMEGNEFVQLFLELTS